MNLERITLDPTIMSGKPCIRGLRVTVANILRQLANHRSPEEILTAYPYLEAADIDAVRPALNNSPYADAIIGYLHEAHAMLQGEQKKRLQQE